MNDSRLHIIHFMPPYSTTHRLGVSFLRSIGLFVLRAIAVVLEWSERRKNLGEKVVGMPPVYKVYS